MRIGQGYDVHAFAEEGEAVVLGGVRIPYRRGFQAHSDGDVLLHALCDALLGAAALGDIGRHFPDSDPRYRGMDSRAFLRTVRSELEVAGWRVGNIDSTLVAQAPRMAPYIGMMRANIAADLHIDVAQVSVKATTTERLGFCGREEGVAAYGIALIEAV